jgi:predicted DNA-binding transcriptional regulator AlpA
MQWEFNKENMEIIQKKFYQIEFPKNIKIKRVGWIEKNKLKEYYKKNDIFLY